MRLKRLDEAWQRRWDARTAPVRVETSASAVIEGMTPEQVWAFLRPAESAVLLLPEVSRAFTVPGTGPGRGEQQCFVTLVEGKEHISRITVTAEEPPAFAEAVVTTSPVPQGSRWETVPVAGGTRLTSSGWIDLPAGTASKHVTMNREAQQAGHETYVRRVKALLESGTVSRYGPTSPSG